jgi:hypothetical protein
MQDQVLLARELGAEGMLQTLLSTPSVVAWRRVRHHSAHQHPQNRTSVATKSRAGGRQICELLHQIMLAERDMDDRPESQQIFDIGFPMLLHFAGAHLLALRIVRHAVACGGD